jgi:hypothetical protein
MIMSDLSYPECPVCHRPEYACECPRDECGDLDPIFEQEALEDPLFEQEEFERMMEGPVDDEEIN